MATINTFQRYLYELKEIDSLPRFSIPKMPESRYYANDGLISRQTFERDEYKVCYKTANAPSIAVATLQTHHH